MQIRCIKCGRIVNVPDNWNRQFTCNTCGGYFQEINQNYQRPGLNLDGIGQEFSKLGDFPHIMVGKGIYSQKPNYPYPTNNLPNLNAQNQNLAYPSQPMTFVDKYADTIKKWALWICVSLIIGYAVWRIFFG